MKPAGTVEDAVAIVDPVADEAVRKHEDRFLSKTVSDRAQTTQLEKNRNDIAVRCGPPSAARCQG